MCTESNILRSITYLMDCFVDDYRVEIDEKESGTPSAKLSDLDLRAQVEVKIFMF